MLGCIIQPLSWPFKRIFRTPDAYSNDITLDCRGGDFQKSLPKLSSPLYSFGRRGGAKVQGALGWYTDPVLVSQRRWMVDLSGVLV